MGTATMPMMTKLARTNAMSMPTRRSASKSRDKNKWTLLLCWSAKKWPALTDKITTATTTTTTTALICTANIISDPCAPLGMERVSSWQPFMMLDALLTLDLASTRRSTTDILFLMKPNLLLILANAFRVFKLTKMVTTTKTKTTTTTTTTITTATTTTTTNKKLLKFASNLMKQLLNARAIWAATLVNTTTLTPVDVNTSTTSSPTWHRPPERSLLDLSLLAVEQQPVLLSYLD